MSFSDDVVKCTKDSETVKQKLPHRLKPKRPDALLPLSAILIASSERPYLPHSSSGTSE